MCGWFHDVLSWIQKEGSTPVLSRTRANVAPRLNSGAARHGNIAELVNARVEVPIHPGFRFESGCFRKTPG